MRTLSIAILMTALATSPASAGTVSLFQDDFDTFSLGTAWQATSWDGGVSGENATGVPDVTLAGGVTRSGAVTLEMASGTNDLGVEFKGIETIDSIPTTGVFSLTLDVRTTGANSHMPIEAALVGSSGEWMKMYYTYAAWKSNYDDSAGNHDDWGSWSSGTTPGEYRRWVMTIDDLGVTSEIYDASDTLRNTWTFTGLTLADLGSTAKLVLRQQLGGTPASPGTAAPRVWVDYVSLIADVPEPGTFVLLAAGGLCAVGYGWGRQRRRPGG